MLYIKSFYKKCVTKKYYEKQSYNKIIDPSFTLPSYLYWRGGSSAGIYSTRGTELLVIWQHWKSPTKMTRPSGINDACPVLKIRTINVLLPLFWWMQNWIFLSHFSTITCHLDPVKFADNNLIRQSHAKADPQHTV